MEMNEMSQEERERRIAELAKELDTLILTASEENYEGERLDAILLEFAKLYPTTEEEVAMFDPEKGLERLYKRMAEMERNRYTLFYNLVVAEEKRIKNDPITDNFRLCKALAACYELQDYLANRLAEYSEESGDCSIKY